MPFRNDDCDVGDRERICNGDGDGDVGDSNHNDCVD